MVNSMVNCVFLHWFTEVDITRFLLICFNSYLACFTKTRFEGVNHAGVYMQLYEGSLLYYLFT